MRRVRRHDRAAGGRVFTGVQAAGERGHGATSRSARRRPTAAACGRQPHHAGVGAAARQDPSTTAGSAFRTAAGATYWRLQFLEILPSASTSGANLVEFGGAGSSQSTLASVPQHLVMDRCYLHGDPGFGQRRGVALNSGDTQIVNSYFSDIKGVSQDTQAIAAGTAPVRS